MEPSAMQGIALSDMGWATKIQKLGLQNNSNDSPFLTVALKLSIAFLVLLFNINNWTCSDVGLKNPSPNTLLMQTGTPILLTAFPQLLHALFTGEMEIPALQVASYLPLGSDMLDLEQNRIVQSEGTYNHHLVRLPCTISYLLFWIWISLSRVIIRKNISFQILHGKFMQLFLSVLTMQIYNGHKFSPAHAIQLHVSM